MSTVIADPKTRSFLNCINRIRPAHKRRHTISKADRAIILAQGKALAMLVTMLQARGHLHAEDYAGTLGLFSAVVAENAPLEGDILAVWSAILKENL